MKDTTGLSGDVVLDDLRASDLGEAHAITRALAWPHRLEDWHRMLALGRGVAVRSEGGALAGTGIAWPWGDRLATVGLILVREDFQRRGLGRLIMGELARCVPGRVLRLSATAAGLRLYESLGFQRVGTVRQLHGEARARGSSPGLRRLEIKDLEAAVALDAETFGADRRRLMLALQETGEGMVIERAGRIAGFGFRRAFGRGNLIGPIVAAGDADARALYDALLADGFNRIDIADVADALVPHIEAAGMRAAGTVVTMTNGAWPDPCGAARLYALSSQAFG